MIGQPDVCERLRIAIDATRKRGEALGHVLFDGPPGLGKTTFAICIPTNWSVGVQLTSGAVLKAPKDLVPYLTNAEERSVLFIDEIHRLPRAVEEYLYTAMEDFRIDIVLGEGVNARTHNLWLKPFTLIGATTRAGMLCGPLRDRFQLREHLGFYTVEELTVLVLRNAKKLQVEIDRAGGARDRPAEPLDAADRQQSPAVGARLCHQPFRRPCDAQSGLRRAGDGGDRRRRTRCPGPPLPGNAHSRFRRRSRRVSRPSRTR